MSLLQKNAAEKLRVEPKPFHEIPDTTTQVTNAANNTTINIDCQNEAAELEQETFVAAKVKIGEQGAQGSEHLSYTEARVLYRELNKDPNQVLADRLATDHLE